MADHRGTGGIEAVTGSGEETERLAAELAAELRTGDVVLVCGEVGSGKTTFVRGACRALGVSGRVTSPTFTVGHVYRAGAGEPGAPAVSHLDLYRLADLDTEEPGLLDDYLGEDRISFIEWPDAPAGELGVRPTHRVTIAHAGGDRRHVSARPQEP